MSLMDGDTMSTAQRYRKKPVIIEAIRFTGPGSEDAVLDWIDGTLASYHTLAGPGAPIKIHTLEGVMEASPGDYIIKGVLGEYYPCKPDIFHATYEAVSEETR
jgi:hypothetical protein